MVRVGTKWDGFKTSIFSVMTQKAQAAGAVNLAQGFPDFDGPDVIKDAAVAAIRGGLNQYAPAPGLPELRRLLAEREAKLTSVRYAWETEVTVFSGATEALYCAMQAFLEAGDEIIALEPFYDSYPAAAHAAGAKLVAVPLTPPTFALDAAALAGAVTPRTRMLIVNTPHNPSGHVLSLGELTAIRDLAVANDLLVITDEVYEELTYAPARHVSLASLPGMAERTIVVSSTSKTFSMTGWKIGYAFAPAPLTQALRAVHQYTVFCSAAPLQAGMIQALKLPEAYFEGFRRDYRAKRDILTTSLQKAGFTCAAPEGTYFVLADYSRIKDVDDVTFATWLTTEIGVAAIPVSAFYADQVKAARELRFVRFAFCKDEATLKAAGNRLATLNPQLPPGPSA